MSKRGRILRDTNAGPGLVTGRRTTTSVHTGRGMGGCGSPSSGLYGFLAIVALAGPFLHYFWKDNRAVLGGTLPLLFMLVIALMVRSEIGSMGGADTAGMPPEMLKQMRDEAMKAVS